MRILLDNVNLGHNSGPNNFALRLNNCFHEKDIFCTQDPKQQVDIKLSFISERFPSRGIPVIQRLDGIYFDLKKNNDVHNRPIKDTYFKADGVVFQSEYSKNLIFKHFGAVENFTIIHNGTDLDKKRSLPSVSLEGLPEDAKVWCCAAHWRPFKRLTENIRYFLEFSGPEDILLVAGAPSSGEVLQHERIKYLGNLPINTLLSVFNSVDNLVHLGRYDSCPNVVVEARAAGCHIICCSNGGTREVAGPDATVVLDEPWDYDLIDVNSPPKLDFTRIIKNDIESSIDINLVAEKYMNFFNKFKE